MAGKIEVTTETEQLNVLLLQSKKLLDEDGSVIELYPSMLAEIVYKLIDPKLKSPGLVHAAALLTLRQLAREVCRAVAGQAERDAELAANQGELFDPLQNRYPAKRNDDHAYVLRAHLTLKERNENIHRLRTEAAAKLAHANALQDETTRLVQAGVLTAAEEEEEEEDSSERELQ